MTTVTVDPSSVLGPVKPMNAVNNGPAVKKPSGGMPRGNFVEYRAAGIPFARTHDSVGCVPGGSHACDITAVFPDFDADENDPRNYDFVFTDHYLDCIRRVGTKIFFRLGQTIESGPKKYGTLPPKDFAKWARICEHVVRHYNEGWGWGLDSTRFTRNIEWSNQFGIEYWEIWNEPDLRATDIDADRQNPGGWLGTTAEFFTFYETVARHLKAAFPDIKVGGPAIAGDVGWSGRWAVRFLEFCRERDVPLDFFSWHAYSTDPSAIAVRCTEVRELLDKHGFAGTESILDEWNYVKGWTDEWLYSLEVQSGRLNQKGAAFTMATMLECQYRPVDMLMYYDARHFSTMNGLFDRTTLLPLKGYYPFYAWSKLAALGTQVACSVVEPDIEAVSSDTGGMGALSGKPAAANAAAIRAVAACGPDGAGAVILARYAEDNNATTTIGVALKVPGADLSRARCHLTDTIRTHTEVPLEFDADCTAVIRLMPNSFALVEWGP